MTSVGPTDHVVVFHSSDFELAGQVGDYLLRGVRDGAALVIATPEHRKLFATELEAGGMDLAAARASGQYVEQDAAATLDRILIGGAPDPAAFWQVLSPMLPPSARPGSPASIQVAAYGDMVALLWDNGQVDAAIELEALWDELARHRQFSLLCAYRIASVQDPVHTDALTQVCSSHTSAVWPALPS